MRPNNGVTDVMTKVYFSYRRWKSSQNSSWLFSSHPVSQEIANMHSQPTPKPHNRRQRQQCPLTSPAPPLNGPTTVVQLLQVHSWKSLQTPEHQPFAQSDTKTTTGCRLGRLCGQLASLTSPAGTQLADVNRHTWRLRQQHSIWRLGQTAVGYMKSPFYALIYFFLQLLKGKCRW